MNAEQKVKLFFTLILLTIAITVLDLTDFYKIAYKTVQANIKKIEKLAFDTSEEPINETIDTTSNEYLTKYWVAGQITINDLTSYNNKTKKEILDERTKFVEHTMFRNMNYKPSDEVFGQIVDKKPWIGITALTCYNQAAIKKMPVYAGVSEESRFINNPAILVGLDRLNYDKKPANLCSYSDYLMPTKLSYSKDNNKITSEYDISSYKGNLKKFILKGLNARDLGFHCGYAPKAENIKFSNPHYNISTNYYLFKDFIHLGSACGITGGCNNGSPHQEELTFEINKLPATLEIKLWREVPETTQNDADINFEIVLK